MAVNNTLQKSNAQSQVIEYQANGEKVKISPQMIKRYLVSGGGNVTDAEVTMFLTLCKYQHLNPFIREAYLIKYGDSQPATMVVGKDVFMKRAKRQPEYDGFEAGIIVRDLETGATENRDGTFYEKELEALVGGWAKVYIKGFRVPVYASVSMNEYIGRKKNGEVNGQWAGKPATMIRKVALLQALREAFPEQNSGIYGQEEIPEAQGIDLDEGTVDVVAEQGVPEVVSEPVSAPTPAPIPEQSVANALFEG